MAKMNDIMNQEIIDRSRELKEDGLGYLEIKKIILDEFYPNQNIDEHRLYESIRHYCGTKKKKKEQPKESLLQLLQKPHSINDLGSKTGMKLKEVLREIDDLISKGHFIKEVGGMWQISKEVFFGAEDVIHQKWNGSKIIKIGVVSDTHFNSNYTQITALNKAYDIFAAEKVKVVYHAGDIDEGEEMRPGHKMECYTQGADAHLEEIVKNYPQRDGVTTYFITGNHDHSMIKRLGFNIGNAIAGLRKDMVYMNADYAKVMLTPNYPMELRHPADGSSYAISYKPQKIVEGMGKDTPKLVIIGHYHKAGYFMHRGVHCILAGTTEMQSGWMRNKGLEAHLGAWILEIHVDDDGNEKQFIPRFFPFEPIHEDWKRHR